MKYLILSLLLLVASGALASDTIGFYFDSEASSNTTQTTVPGELVMGYLVLHEASHQESIGQWRGNVRLVSQVGPDPTVAWQFPGSMYNLSSAPEFDVFSLNPLPWAEDIVLAVAYISVPDPANEVEVLVSAPHEIQLFSNGNFPVLQPTYSFGDDYVQSPMTQTSGNSYQPVALINDNGEPVPWPTLTIHTFSGTYGDMVLGEMVFGAMRSFYYDYNGLPDRPLQAIMNPLGQGTLLRQLEDMYSPWGSYIYGDSPDPVWVEMTSGDNYEYPSILWHAYPDTIGENQEYGLEIVFGDQAQSVSRIFNIYPDPCVTKVRHGWNGDWETNWDASPFDLGWTPVGVTRDYYVIIRNISEPDLLLDVEITGSSDFTLMDELPESVSGESYYYFMVRFAPQTPGIHELSITWGNEICETVNLMGTGRVSSDSPVPEPGQAPLLSNYPNPFNPVTRIAFELATSQLVDLAIFDVGGRLVRNLLLETRSPGRHEITWDGQDNQGQACASGVYFSRLKAGDHQAVDHMTLVR